MVGRGYWIGLPWGFDYGGKCGWEEELVMIHELVWGFWSCVSSGHWVEVCYEMREGREVVVLFAVG